MTKIIKMFRTRPILSSPTCNSQHNSIKKRQPNAVWEKSGKRGSNSRPQPWQGCALPTELFPRFCESASLILHSLAKVGNLILLRQGCALPTELFPHCNWNLILVNCEGDETRTHTTQRSLPPQSSASTNSATPP